MLPSVFDTCLPRDEIRDGDLSLDLFAAKLRLVVEGNAPNVYREADRFFSNTYATDGLKTLIQEVFGRLTKTISGSPVIRLETSFGGGKTHDEIALWHIAKKGRSISGLDRFVDDLALIPDRPIQTAAIACQDLDPVNGIYHPESGITTRTIWGEIAYQIGQVEGYSLLRGSDEQQVSPGTVVLERLFQGQPTLIVLDEIAHYLRRAKATVVGKSDLAEQLVAFMFSLMDLASACDNVVLVYALASSTDSFAEETTEIREAIRTSARQERVLSPSTDVEIYNIVKQRLFSNIEQKAAQGAASDYLQVYRSSKIHNLPDGCKDASYLQAIEDSYPFHPELFNLLTKKIASIPEFQRTRGALRLFARLVRYLWQSPKEWIPMIHPHHLPIGIEDEISSELTSRLQRPQMRLSIGADIYNPNGREAYAQVQDQEWLAAGKPPFSSWVSRTIFLHSLNQGSAAGIRRAELNLSLLTPGLEISFIDRALEKLSGVAWYLDVDPITTIARFKEEPSINKIVAEEKEQVGVTEAKEDLRRRRDSIFASKFFDLVAGPEGAHEVDDKADSVALCVIDFNEATVSSSLDSAPAIAEQIFGNTGDSGKFRTFRNRLLFLVANQQELDRSLDIAREYKAIQNILRSPNRLEDLSESQQKQLKQKEGEMDLAVRISLTNAYRHLFYPSNDVVKAPKGLMHYTLPAQDSSTVKGNRNQQDIILKALKDCTKIRPEDAAPYAPAYLLQKVWPSGLQSLTTKALKEAFAKDLSLNILLDAEVSKIRDTIRQGLVLGQWDLKFGDQLFIHEDGTVLALPTMIEFSERMELYRRGLLERPKPKEIELNAQVFAGAGTERKVRVRWRAKGALKVALYQSGTLVQEDFNPSDEYEEILQGATTFRVVADYGNGEVAEAQANASIQSSSASSSASPAAFTGDLFKAKPETFELSGTPIKVFNDLSDRIQDDKITEIRGLELTVEQVMDYRKIGTALPLLTRFSVQVEQLVTLQTGEQFVRLEYQGNIKGFQSFFSPINTLLNTSETQANVMLKLIFEFSHPLEPKGVEIAAIQQVLGRNPVERMVAQFRVTY
jgi:Protein of unknown function (DUF499)